MTRRVVLGVEHGLVGAYSSRLELPGTGRDPAQRYATSVQLSQVTFRVTPSANWIQLSRCCVKSPIQIWEYYSTHSSTSPCIRDPVLINEAGRMSRYASRARCERGMDVSVLLAAGECPASIASPRALLCNTVQMHASQV